MRYSIAEPIVLSSSGAAYDGRVYFAGMLLGTDGVNDPVITVYDNNTNSGVEIVPTATYDASVLGLNGAMPNFLIDCQNGIYVEITTAGACEVTVFYRKY